MSDKLFLKLPRYTITATVAADATTTPEIDLGNTRLVGVFVPSTFDGTIFKIGVASATGGTFLNLIGSDGNDVSYTVAASKYLALTDAQAAQLAGARFIKIICSTTQTTTTTVFTLATVPR